ncbi:MAG: haloacid dehalogenase type II [Sarcina sp.]
MSNIKICVFDAYGTLFDFNSAVNKYKKTLGAQYEEFSKVWRNKQLEYSFLREIMNSYKDFFEVTKDALKYTMEFFNIVDRELEEKLMETYLKLDSYEEVKDFMKLLKEKDVKKVILSNGSKDMLNSAIKSADLENEIDEAISVEEIGIFKPNKKVYEIIVNKYKVSKEEVVFFSSNGWDIAGATKYGFKTIWINRNNLPVEKLGNKPTIVVQSLKESLNKF